MENPNKITVKVLHRESKSGIPNIEVTAYDHSQQGGGSPGGIRISSGLTDEQGMCIIEYSGDTSGGGGLPNPNPGPNPRPNPNRPDLIITLTAPFRADGENEGNKVLATTPVRKGASPYENFLFELSTEKILDAGLPVPGIPILTSNPEQEEAAQESINQRLRQINRTKFQNQLEKRKKVKNFELDFKKSVSKVREDDSSVLHDEEDLEEKQNAVVQKKIVEVNESPVNAEGVILLSPEQQELLAPHISQDGTHYENVPAYIIDPILYPAEEDKKKPTFLLRNNPVAAYCRKKTAEEICSENFLEDNSNEPEEVTEEAPSGNGTLTSEDIPNYLSKLISLQTSPEEKVSFGQVQSSRRPDQADVQNSINSFVLEKGPADSVAYYDFHSIQIAFDHIWKEAIDQGVLDLAKSAYEEIVNLLGPIDGDGGIDIKNSKDLLEVGHLVRQAMVTNPPAKVSANLDITHEQWNNLSPIFQNALKGIAESMDNQVNRPNMTHGRFSDLMTRKRKEQGERIQTSAEDDKYLSLHKILSDLNKRLKEKYAFTVFPVKENGQRSINFGVIATYRQKWEPLNYQAGELVKTITLAPKEERKFTYKTVIKRKRSEKEVEKFSSTRKEEMNTTSRADAEIIRKAMAKTNFSLNAQGTYTTGLYSAEAQTTVGRDAQTDSQETKKDFREAVQKASQEYKSERSLEIATEETYETEMTESGTISNPNDELAVTYLFYELQRRYRVSEEIHRLTPIVLVAASVPEPQEIDEDWLIAHDWILKRVILDDSFLPALSYLSNNIVGDESALEELKKNLILQRRMVEELTQEALELKKQVENRYTALEEELKERYVEEKDAENDTFFNNVLEFFVGGQEAVEAGKSILQATEDAYQRAIDQAKEADAKLQREITALNAISEKYTKLLSQHLNRKTQVERCKVHLKDNILYYMQAIWSHQPPDQRFFELFNTSVPHFEIEEKTYTIEVAEAEHIWTSTENGVKPHTFKLNTNIKSNLTYKKLIEVADVDRLLGFKGNYMIFPLKEPNALTEFMMAPYVDVAFGLRDPDEFGNMNLRDFAKYICCLHEEMSEAQFEAIKPVLKEYYKFLLTSPLRPGEDIIVPTDSLFIEALPAKHALLEDFKLMHRAIDVKKVQAEIREMEIDNLRQAARILVDNFEDPDVEKKILIEGNNSSVVLAEGE